MASSPVVEFTASRPSGLRPHLCRTLQRAALVVLSVSMLAPLGGAGASSSLAATCDHSTMRQAYAPRGFGGYLCRDDQCTSHKAGFDWAERNGIADARACTSRQDPAFAEGCRAYAEEAVTAEQAGFDWARENEIDDTCDCAGAGPGFDAGCTAYITGLAQ